MRLYIMVGILLLAAGILGGCTQPQLSSEDTYTGVTPAEAKALIDENPDLVIIDVSPYYEQGHLPGAVNYYLGELDEAIPTLDKSQKYLLYCHIDNAAIEGAQKMVNAGFQDVYYLIGSYQAWVDAGFPIEK